MLSMENVVNADEVVNEDADENRMPSVYDIVTIFGKLENCEIDKKILINNVLKTIDVRFFF